MKTIYILLIVLFACLSIYSQEKKENANLKVLCITPDKLGANFNFSIDNFEDFGWSVTWAGLSETVSTCQWSLPLGHVPISVDTLIDDIDYISYWDVIAIMPASWRTGNAYEDLLNSPKVMALLRQANENDLIIWATCAGVRVLAAADILNGVHITGKAIFQSEYLTAGAIYLGENIPPVIDGNIITSTRGMYYHYQNTNSIINAHVLL